MSRAVYTFVDLETNETADVIEFDLIENPGSRAWQYAVMLNSPERSTSLMSPIEIPRPLTTDVFSKYQVLKDTVEKLAVTDFPYPEVLPENFDTVDQELMNRLHRHFTNSCLDLWDLRYPRQNVTDVDRILQKLNSLVHALENYLSTNVKIKYGKSRTEVWTICNGMGLSYDIFPLRQYHSYEPADLIMGGHILGKTLLESFKCQDTPTSWDTRGHMRTNGDANMLLENFRQEIYNSQDFTDWLTQHGTDKNRSFADFPLGYFVPGHKQKLKELIKTLKKYSVKVHILL
jgi:hypothetical protein